MCCGRVCVCVLLSVCFFFFGENSPATYQRYTIARLLERIDRFAVRNVHHAHLVHRHDAVVHLQPAVDVGRTARYHLGDVDRRIEIDVRVVGAARDREAEPGRATDQRDLVVLPR